MSEPEKKPEPKTQISQMLVELHNETDKELDAPMISGMLYTFGKFLFDSDLRAVITIQKLEPKKEDGKNSKESQ